jgi:hypothetical protein
VWAWATGEPVPEPVERGEGLGRRIQPHRARHSWTRHARGAILISVTINHRGPVEWHLAIRCRKTTRNGRICDCDSARGVIPCEMSRYPAGYQLGVLPRRSRRDC